MSQYFPKILSISLGMVIIDEIRLPSKPPIKDVAGGSASYVTLGGRLFAGTIRASDVGCLILAGQDFPESVEKRLLEWDMTLVLKKQNALSSRGLLEYGDDTFGPKTFQYTTEPLKPSPADLVDTPLLSAKAVHFLASPEEIQTQVPELLSLRDRQGITERPLIVWEPFPAACKTQNRQSLLDACKLVDIFSPNHLEITALFVEIIPKGFTPEKLEEYASEVLDSSVGPSGEGAVIIRAAEHGSLTMSRSTKAIWLPAFYEGGSSKVKDTTGAGNAFLGGYMAGWHIAQDVTEAACYGHVAASFALEQIGLPKYEQLGDEELWNGVSVMGRVEAYKMSLRGGKVRSEAFV
ncbi:pfkB family kinase [Zopfia rhizophila CBS 207.26]|uniref:PfkB family kinase n=1 Tax=Zopfia rhizophila CBS 207.26 TaxID=1314779 RepID=A0A6A6DU28_9PEZI|nr:pfkB family kinase [Zopfia rhizophila CBS 207.26]